MYALVNRISVHFMQCKSVHEETVIHELRILQSKNISKCKEIKQMRDMKQSKRESHIWTHITLDCLCIHQDTLIGVQPAGLHLKSLNCPFFSIGVMLKCSPRQMCRMSMVPRHKPAVSLPLDRLAITHCITHCHFMPFYSLLHHPSPYHHQLV